MGYHLAGFDEIVGVDIAPQPHYPFAFVQADAMTYPLEGFDAIHASPPCEAFTQMSARWRGKGGKADSHPDLLTPTRARLKALSVPWVIENVVGARRFMQPTLMLHGGMFDLGVHRPRLFESNVLLLAYYARPVEEPIGVYGDRPDGRTLRYRTNLTSGKRSLIRAARTLDEAREAMQVDWMNWQEIRKAIPPAYTELIGRQLLDAARLMAA